MKLACLVAVLALAGCKKKSKYEPAPANSRDPTEVLDLDPKTKTLKPDPPVPAEPPLPKSDPNATVEKLLDDVRPMLTNHYGAVIRTFTASYVRRDGTLDPTYGELKIDTVTPVDAIDDPNRPIGAPTKATVKAAERTQCPILKFTNGTWTRHFNGCAHGDPISFNCKVSDIWDRAIRDKHAPPGALATVERDDSPDAWFFTIVDEPRKIHLTTNYHDDVCTK